MGPEGLQEVSRNLRLTNSRGRAGSYDSLVAAAEGYWRAFQNPENEAAATAHLTFEGTPKQYLDGVPPDVAARIPSEKWEED